MVEFCDQLRRIFIFETFGRFDQATLRGVDDCQDSQERVRSAVKRSLALLSFPEVGKAGAARPVSLSFFGGPKLPFLTWTSSWETDQPG